MEHADNYYHGAGCFDAYRVLRSFEVENIGSRRKRVSSFFAGSKTAYSVRVGQGGMIERLQVLDSMFGKENVI